jgi:uncharacterized UBP type Zn finger protein
MMPPVMHRRHGTAGLHSCARDAATSPVEPLSTGCAPCREHGKGWVELWLCLSCGWVACSDNSPNQHARAHYEETDHPVAVPLQDCPRLGGGYQDMQK